MSDTAAAIRANTKYTEDNIPRIVDEVCELIACGFSLAEALLQKAEYPSYARWFVILAENADAQDKYARARELQQDYEADNIITIADTDPDAARARNRIDARKWRASKLAAKKYGDRIGIDLTNTRTVDAIDAQITQLLAAAGVGGPAGGTEADDRPDAAGAVSSVS